MLPDYKDDEVVFAPDVVAATAVDIINYCQTSPRLPHLGGREATGPEKKTIVVLAGKVPEQGPKPPGFRPFRSMFPPSNVSVNSS